MTMTTVSPAEARQLIEDGATLIDIREPDEHARECIPGAINVPLARLELLPAGPLLFHCRSGMRSDANASRLAAAANGSAHLLGGGIDAWRAAGLPTDLDPGRSIEIMRQVQLAAGALVLIGVVFGVLVTPAFFGLSAFVGAGLMVAGGTGWCGMATMLRAMPWNRRARTA